jgi:hypothetical protein
MGLRFFHLLFIALSVLLMAFVAAWATGQYRQEHDVLYVLWGAGAAALGAILVIYGATFQRKTKNL